ncbi:hypothetical protein CMV_009640 [Castanea mollissima]|uniref:Uncharacterized protein n=1 Tax=Castanea mollissima TaxID=60419 RepID=A0A8J4RKC7_9ROSI|nr:hypothetical protein CMV_009640 [Castanea mollissima]
MIGEEEFLGARFNPESCTGIVCLPFSIVKHDFHLLGTAVLSYSVLKSTPENCEFLTVTLFDSCGYSI